MRITKLAETSAVVTFKVEGVLTPESVLAVDAECRECLTRGKWVHLDVMDARFVERARVAMRRLKSLDGLHVVKATSPESRR